MSQPASGAGTPERDSTEPVQETSTRRALWLFALPALALLLGDLVLTWVVVPDALDLQTAVELSAQSVLQLLAVAGFLTFGLAVLVLGALALLAVVGWRWSFAARLCVVGVGWLATDQLIYSQLVTTHWTMRGLRPGFLMLAALLVGAHWILRHRSRAALHLWVSVICAAGVVLTWVAFGASICIFTPKYLREPAEVMLLHQMQLLWVLAALCFSPGQILRRRAWLLGGLLLFLGATGLASLLSGRSEYIVVTSLESARAARGFNRRVAQLPPLRSLSWLRRLVGTRPALPKRYAKAPSRRLRCTRASTAQARSVLLLSVDALRSDYFGVGSERLPALSRFRGGALEFTRAYQTTSYTAGSMYSLQSGRYPSAPRSATIKQLARVLGLAIPESYLTQRSKESPRQFAKRILTVMARLRKQSPGIFVHAHFMSLHMPAYKALASHDYRKELILIDTALGWLLSQVRSGGLADSTAVIITADHGEELRSERGYFGHAYGVSETQLRTPLLLRVPGVKPGIRTEPVSGVDVLPTVLEVLGARCNHPAHGRSLLHSLPRQRILFASSAGAANRRPLYSDRHMALQWPYKLIYDRGANARALYNLATDPRERHNIVDRHPRIQAKLFRELGSYLRGDLPEYPAAR